MKKKIVIISFAFVVVGMLGIFISCSLAKPKQLFHINADDVAQIEVASGSTGNRVYVEDREDIARIVEEMNNMQYVRKKTFEIMIGWWLRVTLYDKDNNIITSFLPGGDTETLEMGRWRYTLVNPSPFDQIFYERYFG